ERGRRQWSGLSGPGDYGVARRLRIPAKEIVCSDLMSIIYRAQRSRQSYVEPLIDISQEKWLGRGVVVRSGIGRQHYFVSPALVDSGCDETRRFRQRRSKSRTRQVM